MTDLRRELDALTCEGCAKGWPIVPGRDIVTHWIPDAELGVRSVHAFRCRSKADQILPLLDAAIACAYEAAAHEVAQLTKPNDECPHEEEVWYCDCCRHDWEKRLLGLPKSVLSLAPKSARNALALRELKAKREEAEWWVKNHLNYAEMGGRAEALDAQIAELESNGGADCSTPPAR